jgi:single-stranded-DNA-specific exonuclease
MLPLVERTLPTDTPLEAPQALANAGLNPWVAQSLALRGVADPALALGQYRLEPYQSLRDVHKVAMTIAKGIVAGERFVVVADYDCDGATACAVAVSGLKAFGANIDFVVPNRFIHGYGLTPSVVEMVVPMNPTWIITVDNGTASNAGVDAANAHGIGVLVTDHHLPGPTLPAAAGIVNPNQPDCPFPSKNLAGVGVMYYVLAAVRDALKAINALPSPEPKLALWLDLVALGTVADVVKLDANNRWLVRQGLRLIRNGGGRPGIKALFEVSGRDWSKANAQDFGFSLGPRINAAGRLEDMTYGIRCLLAETEEEALHYAYQLDDFNRRRKDIEGEMKETAWQTIDLEGQAGKFTRVVYDPTFHEGVIGIVAGRIKEQDNTPVVVFAKGQEENLIKGSGRSIPGVHLRDALDLVHKRGGNLFTKFGGHAMAAGMTLPEDRLEDFTRLFEEAVKEMMGGQLSQKYVLIDGSLPEHALDLETVEAFCDQVWGQGFEEPTFVGEFDLLEARLIGAEQNHLKMRVRLGEREFDALHFFCAEIPQGDRITLAYRVSVNEFRGNRAVNLMVVEKS